MSIGWWVAIGLAAFGLLYIWALCCMAKRGDMRVTRKEYYGEHTET